MNEPKVEENYEEHYEDFINQMTQPCICCGGKAAYFMNVMLPKYSGLITLCETCKNDDNHQENMNEKLKKFF